MSEQQGPTPTVGPADGRGPHDHNAGETQMPSPSHPGRGHHGALRAARWVLQPYCMKETEHVSPTGGQTGHCLLPVAFRQDPTYEAEFGLRSKIRQVTDQGGDSLDRQKGIQSGGDP